MLLSPSDVPEVPADRAVEAVDPDFQELVWDVLEQAKRLLSHLGKILAQLLLPIHVPYRLACFLACQLTPLAQATTRRTTPDHRASAWRCPTRPRRRAFRKSRACTCGCSPYGSTPLP